MPVVEQPAAQAAVAVDGKGDAEPAARCCPRAERDAETGDAIYYPMCGGRVPARRYQCGIAVCGPGGCALCCASLCLRSVVGAAAARAAQESEIPNFKGSDLGHFPLVSADFWTSDHLSERSRSVDVFSVTRARGTLTLKRR